MKRRGFLLGLATAPWLSSLPTGAIGAAGTSEAVAATYGRIPEPDAIRRVFAAGPPASVLLSVLAPERLIGWPFEIGNEARAWLAPRLRTLPRIGRLAGRGSTVSTESLLQMKPDLILDVGTVDATYLSGMQRVAEQTALPCLLMHGELAGHPAQLRVLGRMLGVTERGERLAAWADETLTLARRIRDELPPQKRPRVYYGRGVDGLETGLDGSINMEAIGAAAGQNVAARAGRGGLTRVSPEQILAWNPEVIVTQDREFARRVLTDPLWRSVDAVGTGRVHLAPTLPFGWLDGPPSVNRLIGVRWLIERLHPGRAGGDPALRAAAAEFIRLFYASEPDADAIATMVGSPAR